MSRSIFRSIAKQLVMVLSIMLILFAAYLSVGRQFMPAISSYKSFVEEQIAEAVGIPVTIDSLTGYFEVFNPAISIQGLRIAVLDNDSSLEFERATIILNMLQTIWQRQVVLEDFVIEGLGISVRQSQDGSWQLIGMNQGPPGTLDLDALYETIQRVSTVELTGLHVEFNTLAGNTTRFLDSTAIIQNASGNHYVHINTSIDGSDNEIEMSVEVTGDSLDQVAGLVHLNLPMDDYTSSSMNEVIGQVKLGGMIGGGRIWITLENGQVRGVALQPEIENMNFSVGGSVLLGFEDISVNANLVRSADNLGWDMAANDLRFTWNRRLWRDSSLYMQYRDNDFIHARADAIDLDIIREVTIESGAASDGLREQLLVLEPRGVLRNLSVNYPLQNTQDDNFELKANIDNVAVNTFRSTPSMSGLNGYIDASYNLERSMLTGVAEVESENFTIRIPNLFIDTWSYDYVNGRLHYKVDLQDKTAVQLSSSMIVAESEIVDGRAQFSSNIIRYPDQERVSDFSLLVGALRVDGSKKTPYLPAAPNISSGLRNTMQWLDRAIVDAAVSGSGIVYRGSTVPNADAFEKTFQGFFVFDQAHLNYVEQWPDLESVAGTVIVDNDVTDISVDQGSSMGLAIGSTTGQVRRNAEGEQWLTVTGNASGPTQAGLDFLAVAPLDNGLGETLETWQAEGEVNADIELRVPFGVASGSTWIKVAAQLENNSLTLPEYQLQVDELAGALDFDSDSGLRTGELRSRFFENDAAIVVSSQPDENGKYITDVQVNGKVDSNVLAQWQGQSEFVRDLLLRTSGEFDYDARLTVQQDSTQQTASRLRINSDLQGVELLMPQPFRKGKTEPEPLSLVLDFDALGTRVQGALGSQLTMRVALTEDSPANGIVYLGTVPGIANPWQSQSNVPGLELRGNLDILNLSEWLDTLSSTESVSSPTSDLTSWVSRVSVDIGILDLFGQQLESVNVDIQGLEDTDYWTVGLVSDAVTGSVLIPFDRQEYIEAYLAFLHLPGPEVEGVEAVAGEVPVAEEAVEEQAKVELTDVLAQIDPRQLPRFKFFTGNFSVGDKDYGLGQFTLDPGPEGAELSNIIANFRGLRIGTTPENAPRFSWLYDGNEHRSYLSGLVLADDLAEVLLSNGYAASLESSDARFDANLNWPGSPAFFNAANLSGTLLLKVEEGRFLQGSGGPGALKLISIINLSAIMRRARFSDDLLRSGLAYEEITGDLFLEDGLVTINDRLIITGPSSVYQIAGEINLEDQTINGEMYVTLPVSDNIPWIGLLTANIPLAIGAYLFDRIFGDQVDSLTSAQYTLQGPWEGLEPELAQAFGGGPGDAASPANVQ